ncbi:MAG: nucleotidyltransferase family protein [Clostridia bacterium]|nr:nucleotidyltransferase family protein [Clostridia bacterium]
MEQAVQIIMQLIGSEVFGNKLSLPDEGCFTDKLLIEMLIISRNHNIAQLVASALLKSGIIENSPQKGLYLNEIYSAVYSQEKMSETCREIYALLEREKIPYIPLKGAVVRGLYPEPWMRVSGDIDILVKEKDKQAATNAILESGGYELKKESAYDVAFVSPNGTLLELHYRLFSDKKSVKRIPDVWASAECDGDSEYRYKLNDGIFCYYHILHMAKHLKNGGCGIRSFIDLRLIEQTYNLDSDEVEKLLKKSGLSVFAYCARRLCAVWFDGQKHDEQTLQLEKYILDGGVFGTEKTKIISQQQRTGGKRQYYLSKIFVPYRSLKYLYPALEKYPFLFPFYEVHRWFSFLFGKRKKFRKNYAALFDRVLSEQPEDYSLFEGLGLK